MGKPTFLGRILADILAPFSKQGKPARLNTMEIPLIAILVGHSRWINGRQDGGAVSHDGKSNEWNFNLPLAVAIRLKLQQAGLRAVIISDYEGSGYTTAIKWVSAKLKSLGASAAIELHFNSASPSATGHEWPYWHSSIKGKELATNLERRVGAALPGIGARGILPRVKGDHVKNNRGWQFCYYTPCPAVICEPGFGSNPSDWRILQERKSELADAIAAAIVDTFQR